MGSTAGLMKEYLESSRELRGWLYRIFLGHYIVMLLISTRLLQVDFSVLSPLKIIYLLATWIGQMALLSYLPLLVMLLVVLLFFVRGGGIFRFTVLVVIVVSEIALLIDTFVFSQYKFHMDGFVWELILNGDAGQLFSFSLVTWIVAVGVVLLLISFHLWIIRLIPKDTVLVRNKATFVMLLFFSLLSSHVIHAWADANYDQQITSLSRYFPALHPMTAKGFFERHDFVDLEKNRKQRIILTEKISGVLNYPEEELHCDISGDRKNILLIVIDTWRGDQLSESVTPNIERMTQKYSRFTNHISGGNSTRSGMFSLFYGLPSTYWKEFESTQTPPVLIQELQKQNYQFGVFASSSLTHPPFDRTIFSSLDNVRLRSQADTPHERDREITNSWIKWLDGQGEDPVDPFFGMLFYDAAHGYSLPTDFEKRFQPSWDQPQHLMLDEEMDPLPYLNLYKNALNFVDMEVGKVLSNLEKRGGMDNTVIVITSDHGEEFNDNGKGFWGHGSNFTDAQLHVPLLLYWPEKEGAVVARRTSHHDVVPTIMKDILGCINGTQVYSSGESLYQQSDREWTIVGSYFNYAVVEEDQLAVSYPTGQIDFFDKKNNVIAPQERDSGVLFSAVKEMSRFYQ